MNNWQLNAFNYSLRKLLFLVLWTDFSIFVIEFSMIHKIYFVSDMLFLSNLIFFITVFIIFFLQNLGKFGVYIPIDVSNNARAYIEMILWFQICTSSCELRFDLHASVMHKYFSSELFHNIVNNELRINVSQHACLTEMMLVKTSVRQITFFYILPYALPLFNVDEFLKMTLP